MKKYFLKNFLALWLLVFAVFITTSCDKNIVDELEAGKRPDNAKEKLVDLISKEPKNIKAQKWMTLLELETDQVDEAESRLAMMMVKFPKEYDTLYTACQFYLKKNDKKASGFCNKALTASGKREVSDLYFLAIAYLNKKNYKEALSLFEEAHKKSPENAEILNSMGFCEMNLGNFNTAIKLFKEALAIDVNKMTAWKNLARVYYDLGDFKESAKTQEEALTHSPKDTELLLNLAVLYYKHLDDPAKGSQFFERAKKNGLEEKKIEQMQAFLKDQPVPGNNLGK